MDIFPKSKMSAAAILFLQNVDFGHNFQSMVTLCTKFDKNSSIYSVEMALI